MPMKNLESLASFCTTSILDIPEGLFAVRDVDLIAAHEDSSIFFKDLESDLTNIEFHTQGPCIVYIQSGKELITTSQNDSLAVSAGELIFLPKGLNLYSDYFHAGEGLNAYLVFLGRDVLTRFFSTDIAPPTAKPSEEAIFKMDASEATCSP